MKYAYIILNLVFGVNSMAQTVTFSWPKPTGYDLYDISFVNQNLGFACGKYGTIIKTTDAGENWEVLNTGVNNTLNIIKFATDKIGWACGDTGLVLKTVDGGKTWSKQTTNTTYNINKASFVNENVAYLGAQQDGILKTINGGQTWIKDARYPQDVNTAVYFLSSDTGFTGGKKSSQRYLLKTIDGGKTWKETVLSSKVKEMFFLDKENGWYVNSSDSVFITSNGGNNWSYLTKSYFSIDRLFFTSISEGWYLSYYKNTLQKTVNGFVTIVSVNDKCADDKKSFTKIGNALWVVGNSGSISKYENNVWKLNKTECNTFWDVDFFDSKNGWASLGYGLMSTNDGGDNWILRKEFVGISNENNVGMDFYGSDTGIVVCDGGRSYKTYDKGVSWNRIISEISACFEPYDVEFVTIKKVIAGCYDTGYKSSNDAGVSWIAGNNSETVGYAMHFPTPSIGYSKPYSSNAKMSKTTDGGMNWKVLPNFSSTSTVKKIFFKTALEGYAVGNLLFSKTIDGGATWQTLSGYDNLDLRYIDFHDKDTGIVLGYNFLLYTTNGGTNWKYLFIGADNMSRSTFINNNTVMIASSYSLIKLSLNANLVTSQQDETTQTYSQVHLHVFPSPALDKITFRYIGIKDDNNQTISIYDSYGKLIDEFRMKSHDYEFNVSAYNSGFYYYKDTNTPTIKGQFQVIH